MADTTTNTQGKMKTYLGNPNLKASGVTINYTEEQLQEYMRCAEDCHYFVTKYVKIIHPDYGIIPFDKPRKYQVELIDSVINHRFTIAKIGRQMGKSTVVIAILLWHVIFNDHFKIALLAHQASQARELLSRIQLAYENLPFWLQQGVNIWNKGSIELENGSIIQAEATSSGSVRGRAFNIVYMDELAHIELNEQEAFFTSTYPTITSGSTTKLIITSTPKGMEYFYKLWMDSVNGRNNYNRVEASWRDMPGRDDAWKEETIRNTSARQFSQEFETEFLGSMSTLIDGKKIGTIITQDPLGTFEDNSLWIYEGAIKDHSYVMTIDSSHGVELDFSSFVVIDISVKPFKIVAKYRSNTIPSIIYPEIIYRVAKTYNDAYCLIESNDIGKQTVDILYRDLEYENVFISESKAAKGQVISMFGGNTKTLGLRMTPATKRIGCMSIKTIIEADRLEINDFHILQEMTVFVADKKKSYSAEPGKHDDLMMCLVMFGWLVHQPFFKDLSDIDVRSDILHNNNVLVAEELAPFGYVADGREHHGTYIDNGALEFTYNDEDFGRF
jgi:hypothetical protein